MFETRLTIYPDVGPDAGGGFQPTSFAELLQQQVELPGLDPAWTHTLVAVAVADDRGSAQLTLHSEPAIAMSLDRGLRIVQGVPPARVRVHDEDGTVLCETSLAAPLQAGQDVEIGGVAHQVVGEPHWPGRHPETGACEGDLDWQHVTVVEQPQPPVTPTAVAEATP